MCPLDETKSKTTDKTMNITKCEDNMVKVPLIPSSLPPCSLLEDLAVNGMRLLTLARGSSSEEDNSELKKDRKDEEVQQPQKRELEDLNEEGRDEEPEEGRREDGEGEFKRQATVSVPVMTGKTLFTKEEVTDHGTPDSCWIILWDRVYDITKFVHEHPGGEDIMYEHSGWDATEAFRDVGHSEEAFHLMNRYCIGSIVPEINASHTWEWLTQGAQPVSFIYEREMTYRPVDIYETRECSTTAMGFQETNQVLS